MHRDRTGVAPYDVIQRDFRVLDAAETLRTTWEVERLILVQSVQGHAHEGHREFAGARYPNTSIDDISRALRLDPAWVRAERQKLIDEIRAYADRVIEGGSSPPLENESGDGLLGSSMFSSLSVEGADVLRGLYLGGLRDDPAFRFEAEKKYGIRIGGGRSYLVDVGVMEDMELDGYMLSHGSHEDKLEKYRDCGLIVGDGGVDGNGMDYMYIRHRTGPGASDDTSMVAAGMLYGLGVAVGVFLADAIDTLEKYVPCFSDQDGTLAEDIKKRFASLGVTDAEIHHLAYLAAAPEENDAEVPDCSLRHLMRVDRRCDQTAIESHLLRVQGRRSARMPIGHDEIPSNRFYDYVADRVKNSPGVR